MLIDTLFTIMNELSSVSLNTIPVVNYDTLCGYNIINYDIPLLIKRFIKNRDKELDVDKVEIKNKKLPLMLKSALNYKPWESAIIDAMNIWKFNGNNITNPTLNLICEHYNLKKKIDILSDYDSNKYYWDNITTNPEKVYEVLALQSATQTNLIIQLMDRMRTL
jgi:DNA polymerase elongation subunit (family B)